jgi:ssDNA-binding Zn-finger/Zn-ribbon topoisomerase 1
MLLRGGKFGKFYGCTKYPNCKGTKPAEWSGKRPENELELIKAKWNSGTSTMVFWRGKDQVAKWIYKDGKPFDKQGSPVSGLVQTFHSNTALKAEIMFENNEMNGPYEEFDMNGNPKEKGTYKNGEKHPSFKSTDDPYAVDKQPDYDTIKEDPHKYADAVETGYEEALLNDINLKEEDVPDEPVRASEPESMPEKKIDDDLPF